MSTLMSYTRKDTPVHRLSGFTKLVFFLLWCITSALTYDTRVLGVMLAISIILFRISKIQWQQIGVVVKVIAFFMILNVLAIFLLSPYQGCTIYQSRTVLFSGIPGHDVTAEELFYFLNMLMKYFIMAPAIFIFLVTTDPSEFAASLNMAGVPYTVGYAISIAIRYIPDIQDDYHKIKNAQEARGIEMSGKARLLQRITRIASILFPLLFSMMERIDVVSNAMELRGFGKHKKRTWYMAKKLTGADVTVLLSTLIFCILALFITFYDGNRFYNPFIG
ncbi:MAG: energy-coupling factor transporter transmembrane component T [Eubacteriales bacterium]|nr:energy-coupling factor transporter transmembrane component T [Eubacteriales bacterium]